MHNVLLIFFFSFSLLKVVFVKMYKRTPCDNYMLNDCGRDEKLTPLCSPSKVLLHAGCGAKVVIIRQQVESQTTNCLSLCLPICMPEEGQYTVILALAAR